MQLLASDEAKANSLSLKGIVCCRHFNRIKSRMHVDRYAAARRCARSYELIRN